MSTIGWLLLEDLHCLDNGLGKFLQRALVRARRKGWGSLPGGSSFYPIYRLTRDRRSGWNPEKGVLQRSICLATSPHATSSRTNTTWTASAYAGERSGNVCVCLSLFILLLWRIWRWVYNSNVIPPSRIIVLSWYIVDLRRSWYTEVRCRRPTLLHLPEWRLPGVAGRWQPYRCPASSPQQCQRLQQSAPWHLGRRTEHSTYIVWHMQLATSVHFCVLWLCFQITLQSGSSTSAAASSSRIAVNQSTVHFSPADSLNVLSSSTNKLLLSLNSSNFRLPDLPTLSADLRTTKLTTNSVS